MDQTRPQTEGSSPKEQTLLPPPSAPFEVLSLPDQQNVFTVKQHQQQKTPCSFVHNIDAGAGRKLSVLVTSNPTRASDWILKHVIERDEPLVGLDTETRADFRSQPSRPRATVHSERRPPAVVQISTRSGNVLVAQLWRMNADLDLLPSQLAALLTSRRTLKVGVSVSCDAHSLVECYFDAKSVRPYGLVDVDSLDLVARQVNPARSESAAEGNSLASLVERYVPEAIESEGLAEGTKAAQRWLRHHRKRSSFSPSDASKWNWEAETLDREMVEYAALDAHYSCAVFERMITLGTTPRLPPADVRSSERRASPSTAEPSSRTVVAFSDSVSISVPLDSVRTFLAKKSRELGSNMPDSKRTLATMISNSCGAIAKRADRISAALCALDALRKERFFEVSPDGDSWHVAGDSRSPSADNESDSSAQFIF